MESKEDNNTTTTGGSGSKKEMSRVEKKALARVFTSGQKSDFTTPKDGFIYRYYIFDSLHLYRVRSPPLSLFPLFFFLITHIHTHRFFADPYSVCLRRRVLVPTRRRTSYILYGILRHLNFFFNITTLENYENSDTNVRTQVHVFSISLVSNLLSGRYFQLTLLRYVKFTVKAKGCGLDDIQSNVQDFNNALTLDYSGTILHVLRMQHSRHFFTTVFCRQSICPVIPSRMFLDRCLGWRTYLCIYEFCAVLHHSLTPSLPHSHTHSLTIQHT